MPFIFASIAILATGLYEHNRLYSKPFITLYDYNNLSSEEQVIVKLRGWNIVEIQSTNHSYPPTRKFKKDL